MDDVGGSNDIAAMLADSAERYAAANYKPEQRRALLGKEVPCSDSSWADYARLGWLALRLPETFGGIGADARVTSALMEVVGSRLLMEPLLASAIVGTGIVLRSGDASLHQALLPKLAAGTLRLALAHQETLKDRAPLGVECVIRRNRLYGRKIAVLHGDIADYLIVTARRASSGAMGLYLVPAQDKRLRRERFALLDGRGAANLCFDGVAVESLVIQEGAPSESAIRDASDEAAVALCSEAYGAIRMLNASTLQYVKLRKQFDRPIGSNQALQHRLVEMVMLEHEVRALNFAAQRALCRSNGARHISGARAYITAAARRISNEAVQMHGGVGITDELEVSHYYRRLMVIGALFGSRDEHFERFLTADAAVEPDSVVQARTQPSITTCEET